LGPTFDDKTLESIAKALKCKLVVNEDAIEMVKKKYEDFSAEIERRNAELTKPRLKMATIPESAIPIRNPGGTAPAVRIDLERTIVIALPGVPAEMQAIFMESVAPLLKEASHGILFYEQSLYLDDIMESVLAPLIDETMRDNPGVYIKSHPRGAENKPHIELHFSFTGGNQQAAQRELRRAVTQLSKLATSSGGRVLP
jgi:molybdopterin-biosynthesis enzyme MoeA-like protein